MNIDIRIVLLLLAIQFFLIKGHLVKDIYVYLRNSHIKPKYRLGEIICLHEESWVIDYIYDNEWTYHYSLTKKTNTNKLASLVNISVPQNRMPKKSKLDKALS